MLHYYALFVLFSIGFGDPQPGLILVNSDDNAKESNVNVEVTKNAESSIDDEDLEVFQPTAEWQTIQPGQGIPPGLHVRMNLQTGQKEAKLMDGDDVLLERALINLTRHMDAKKNFRSIEDIRKELEGADIFVKKDIEIIKKHVETLNSTSSSLPEKEHALDELEFYVHQIDNAIDLDTIGGLTLVIKLMNSTDPSLVRRATYVLGSATQSNPNVQQAALKQGALPLLLRLLSNQDNMAVRKKAMYALSSLIRLFPMAQRDFLKLNGLEIFKMLFEESGSGALAVKAITLMTDILTEQIQHVKALLEKQGKDTSGDISGRVPLLKTMAEKGWCQLVPSLLHTTENDTREKVLQALHVMVEGCKSEFQQPRVHDSLNKLKLEWLKDANRKEGHEDPEYVTILAQLVTDLISKLT
ncbi:nucleotide exchange factorsil1 [Porites harrisoni]